MITKTGLALANFSISPKSRKATHISQRMSEEAEMSLFAGFISASISMFQELEEKMIDEIIYHEYKIVVHPTDNLYYLAITSSKVPTSLSVNFLKKLSSRMEYFLDFSEKIIEITSDTTEQAEMITNRVLQEEFWWMDPEYTPENNINLFKTLFLSPSHSFYIRQLPPVFIVTAALIWLGLLFVGTLFGTTFIGMQTVATPQPSESVSLVSILSIWLLSAAILKLWIGDDFNGSGYLIISGIYGLILYPMIFLGSEFYTARIFEPIIDGISVELIQRLISLIMFWLPFNLSFIFYFIMTGYTSSNLHNMPAGEFSVKYALVIVSVLAAVVAVFGISFEFIS